eukprot:CAMPEP_0117445630 /NCGR_PEP_ID=MMETSP0759-20121206/5902_1 /TAXON_ID=63605 /ORGANISM="Percolomonas cosmopolitus, Strain WS" /LENGTH=744 /DNA_ID=CAMNT_0005237827 /DNA_START=187 /DNA_END=2422 /DNA_ORIENTATION=+
MAPSPQDLIQQKLLAQKRVLKERIQFVSSRYSNEGFFMNRANVEPVPGTDGCAFLITDPDILTKQVHQQKLISPNSKGALKSMQENLQEDYMHIDTPLPAPSHFLFSSEKLNSEEMMRWNSKLTIPVIGMFNMKNTCFVNSVLQSLLYTTPLVNFVAQRDVAPDYDPKGRFNAIDAFTRLWKNVKKHGKKALEPEEFAYNIKVIGKDFVLGKQGDAHEFTLELIDKMERALLEKFDGSLDRRTCETNVVHQIFGGYLRSQIKSLESRFSSNTYDPFIDLSVNVLDNNSVEDGLRQYIEPCNLDGDDKYYNSRSKKYEKATQTITIHQAPPILILHLKRFSDSGRKISKHIRYPEVLNLTPYMSVQDDIQSYELYAALVHSGRTSGSGHYYCFVKTSADVWYKMDDSKTSSSNIKQVLNQPAYILFYRKIVKDSPALPSPGTPFSAVHQTPKALFEALREGDSVRNIHDDGSPLPLRKMQRRGSGGSQADAKYKQNKPSSLQIPTEVQMNGSVDSTSESASGEKERASPQLEDAQLRPELVATTEDIDVDHYSDIDEEADRNVAADTSDESFQFEQESSQVTTTSRKRKSTKVLGSFDPNAAEDKARSSKYHQSVETWDDSQKESTIRERNTKKRYRDELDQTLDRGKLKKKKVKEEWTSDGAKSFQRAAKRLYGDDGGILSNVVDEAEVEEDVSVVNVVVLVIEDEAEEGMVLDTEEEVMEIEGTDKLQMNQRAGISCVTIRVR